MTCQRASEELYQDRRGIARVALWAHSVVCPRCRAEARFRRALRQVLQEVGRFEPPADLLPAILAVPGEGAVKPPTIKEGRKMKRIVYATIAMLVIVAGAVVIPGRWEKRDARSILTGVAHALENAESVYLVGRGTELAPDSPAGKRMSRGHYELWTSSQAVYMCSFDAEGALAVRFAVNVGTNEFWVYDRAKATLCTADITPIASGVAELIESWAQMMRSAAFNEILEATMANATESVETETRDGREVSILIFTGTPKKPPQPGLTMRFVFEVDPETNHLLTMRQYAKAEGRSEELIQAIDRVEHDVPLPAEFAAFKPPAGTKTVTATAAIEETEDTLNLSMKADGVDVSFGQVPRKKK